MNDYIIYYLKDDKSRKKDMGISFRYKVENDEGSNIRVDNTGLLVTDKRRFDHDFSGYKDEIHLNVSPDELESTRIKVIDAIELSEVERLKLEKSFLKKTLSLFAEVRYDFINSSFIKSSNLFLFCSLLQVVAGSLHFSDGRILVGALNVISASFLAYASNMNVRRRPLKTLRAIKYYFMSDEEKQRIMEDAYELGAKEIIDAINDNDNNRLYTFSENDEDIKRLCKSSKPIHNK